MRGLVYNNLDWLALRAVKQYINFTDQQEEIYDSQIKKWVNDSKDLTFSIMKKRLKLVLSKNEKTEKISKEDFESLMIGFLEARTQFLINGSSLLASFFKDLSNEQIVAFAEKMSENEKDYIAILTAEKGEYSDLIEERIDVIEDRLEDWIGNLSKQQRDIIRTYWWKDRDFVLQRFLNRKSLQANFLKIVIESDQKKLEQFFIEWAEDYRHLNKITLESEEQDLFKVEVFLDQLFTSLSKNQHKILKKQLKELDQDLSSIL